MTNGLQQSAGTKPARARATKRSREAIAAFIDGNLGHLNTWLMQVASGIPKCNARGEHLRDGEGSVVWVNKPDPQAAIKAIAEIAEYHMPKLSRQEVSATVEHVDPTKMSKAQLERAILASLGVDAVDGEFVQVPDALPAFLQREQAG